MKKQLFFWIFIYFLMCTINVDAIYKHSFVLETDPDYLKAKDTVLLLKENFAYARQGAKTGMRYGAAYGVVSGGLTFNIVAKRAYQWVVEKKGIMEAERRKPYLLPSVIIFGIPANTGIYAGIGATLGASINVTKRKYMLWKINSALSQYTTKYNFMTMPVHEAVMVLAAYQRDLPLMEKIKPHIEHFLKQQGIWEALVQLYFGKVTPENIEKLKVALE